MARWEVLVAGLGISGFVIAFTTRGVFFRSLIYLLEFSNSLCIVFVLCVWVRGSQSCICSRPLLSSLFRVVCCFPCGFLLFVSWCCGAPFFCCCCSVLWLVAVFVCFSVCLGCVRFGSLFPGFVLLLRFSRYINR